MFWNELKSVFTTAPPDNVFKVKYVGATNVQLTSGSSSQVYRQQIGNLSLRHILTDGVVSKKFHLHLEDTEVKLVDKSSGLTFLSVPYRSLASYRLVRVNDETVMLVLFVLSSNVPCNSHADKRLKCYGFSGGADMYTAWQQLSQHEASSGGETAELRKKCSELAVEWWKV